MPHKTESEAERKARQNQERLANRTARIEIAISEKGIAAVLAEMAEDLKIRRFFRSDTQETPVPEDWQFKPPLAGVWHGRL